MTVASRLTGRRLQQARDDLFRLHPYCQRCEDDGRQVQATVRKHIIPLDDGGTEDRSNIIALCLDCAEAQHAIERRRGVTAYGFTPDFQQAARPRDAAGHFSVRHATRLQTPDADTPPERKRPKTGPKKKPVKAAAPKKKAAKPAPVKRRRTIRR